jgi:hypothetical protein
MARQIDDLSGQVGHCRKCGFADVLHDGLCDECVGLPPERQEEQPSDTHQWSGYEDGVPGTQFP